MVHSGGMMEQRTEYLQYDYSVDIDDTGWILYRGGDYPVASGSEKTKFFRNRAVRHWIKVDKKERGIHD